ncbi:MAG: SDR family NAD(P)-dependent oxidoreductase [Actinomycetota bacterium]|nr:SDR family NAD(P)-dependent oxidoreductase [Actinomycetota bacterium]
MSARACESRTGLELAIVGLACRFPGAGSPEDFWRNLDAGVESISFFTREELQSACVDPQLLDNPEYVRARGVLQGADLFDARFFTINPREAEILDPQQRVFLECCWEALENSGYDPGQGRDVVGVYGGAYENSYVANLRSEPELLEYGGGLLRHVSSEKDYVTTRVAYKLGLGGPAVTVQTACSTSLVAVHLAGQALLSGECDLALAGGVTVHARQTSGYVFQPDGIFSPDGHTRTFDAKAQGTVSSSGVGVVVLKRLEDALSAGDTIRAVVRGSAVTNDGAGKVGFTAPSIDGQARAILAAHALAGVSPETITYVEAHGSGTALGDPIEIEALNRVFREQTRRRGFCAVGSVKTNIGHTHAAAGVAGLIKTVLALEHGTIPPSLNFETPNPAIDFDTSPFYVPTTPTEWLNGDVPRRAGVSSFGTGGTNAHVVVEEAPERRPVEHSRKWQLLPLSAKTETALEKATKRLSEHLEARPDLPLPHVAYTLQIGRRAFENRRFAVSRAAPEAIDLLNGHGPRRVHSKKSSGTPRPLAFLFPGLGEQYQGAGRELYDSEPVFRQEIDRGAPILKARLGFDVRDVLYGGGAAPMAAESRAPGAGPELRALLAREPAGPDQADDRSSRTLYSQPAVFLLEYALARLWMSWGVEPQAMLGYSIGEYVAACLAGVLSLEDSLFVVAERARLVEQLPSGGMLAVPLPEDAVRSLIDDDVSLAAANGPSLCVVAGPSRAIAALETRMTTENVACRRLRTAHAFHSTMMEPIFDALVELMRSVTLMAPRIPYVSNLTGEWISELEVTSPTYWAEHLCRPVRFGDGLRNLWQVQGRVVLEVGPASALPSMALQGMPRGSQADPVALASLPPSYDRQPEVAFLLTTAGRLWLEGVPIRWRSLHAGEQRRRVPLPSYPFDRTRHWIEPQHDGQDDGHRARSPERRADVRDWFSLPGWRSTAAPHPAEASTANAGTARCWLLFADDHGVAAGIAQRLAEGGQRVTTVVGGAEFAQLGPRHYQIKPAAPEDYDALLQTIAEEGEAPDQVAHLWGVTAENGEGRDVNTVRHELERTFYSLVFLAQALAKRAPSEPQRLVAIANGISAVTGDERVRPAKATILGPCQVLPQEQPQIRCQAIDIALPPAGSAEAARLVAALTSELLSDSSGENVAYRGRRRWVQTFDSSPLDPAPDRLSLLRPRGTYLITGGLGGMGLVFAHYLASTLQVNLVLLGRSSFPVHEDWGDWLASHGAQDAMSVKIRKLQAIEGLGADVMIVSADCTDERQMEIAVGAARARFGRIDGVIHAAGVPAEGLTQLKDRAAAARVLAPKVFGTLLLEGVFRDSPLDFLVLCSSTIALTGGVGQVDYCAANAFLDAFAQSTQGIDGRFTVSINWDAWQEVGMTHDVVTGAVQRPPGSSPGDPLPPHPWLERCLVSSPDLSVYSTELGTEKHWLVNEHRMLGRAMVPGTAHMELMRAAWEAQAPGTAVAIEELIFLSPVTVPEDDTREIRVVLRRSGDSADASVLSRHRQAVGGAWAWHENARARITSVELQSVKHDVASLVQRLRGERLTGLVHKGQMTLGPRSQCLDWVQVGEGEVLARIALPPEFREDLERLKLHPFLLDIATGFASLYLEEDYYIPLRYGSVLIEGALPSAFYSHLRYRVPGGDGAGASNRETLELDIVLMDEEGNELVRVEEFVMKRARDLAGKLAALDQGLAEEVVVVPDFAGGADLRNGGSDVFRGHLEAGLRPSEGVDALERILARRPGPQVVVATRDINDVRERMKGGGAELGLVDRPHAARAVHPRPNALTPYVAPRDTVEGRLAALWRELLGLQEVGVDDNFFELGGHSLLGVQLVARVRDEFQIDLSLQALFDALTVAELAGAVRSAMGKGQAGSVRRQKGRSSTHPPLAESRS